MIPIYNAITWLSLHIVILKIKGIQTGIKLLSPVLSNMIIISHLPEIGS